MIEELSIRDLGVIADARIPLGAGFTVLTGETGAGKTMVVSALGLLLGARADAAALRSGARQAVVEGRWLIDPRGAVAERVREAGGDVDADEVILSRSVSAEGRSRAVVGGRGAPVGVLSELGEQLVVVHGQADQARLRTAAAQRDALDRFIGSSAESVLTEYRSAYRQWQSDQGELEVLIAEADRRAREADDLRDAVATIEAVSPQRGEDLALAERADRLTNLEELRLAATAAHDGLSAADDSGLPDVATLLADAHKQLVRVAPYDSSLSTISDAVAAASIMVGEVTISLSAYLSGLDADVGVELDTINDRRAQLASLVRRFGPALDDVIDHGESAGVRLLELDNDSTRIELLAARVAETRAALIDAAARLSAIRRAGADALSDRVTDELGALAMADASVTVAVEDRSDYSSTGKDEIAFLMRPHPGAERRPLSRGASGGELSRIMLAIEVVIAGSDPVPTFVFDEIDAGVGGAAATEIGRRLAELSRTAQVIVVTHLAQVAAFATHHLRVTKNADDNVTSSSVEVLDSETRIAEIARLLSGLPGSTNALAHARELVENARVR